MKKAPSAAIKILTSFVLEGVEVAPGFRAEEFSRQPHTHSRSSGVFGLCSKDTETNTAPGHYCMVLLGGDESQARKTPQCGVVNARTRALRGWGSRPSGVLRADGLPRGDDARTGLGSTGSGSRGEELGCRTLGRGETHTEPRAMSGRNRRLMRCTGRGCRDLPWRSGRCPRRERL